MAAKKLSEITQGTPGASDFVVGVTSTNQDRLFPISDVGGGRRVLGGNTNFFVSSTGSDSSDGLTLGTAWATTQHAAFAVASGYDLAGHAAIVNVGAGSFGGFGLATCVGGGILCFQGAGLALTTITGGPNDGTFNNGECISFNQNGFFDTEFVVDGVTLSNPGIGTHGVGIGIYLPCVVDIAGSVSQGLGIAFQTANEGIGSFCTCLIFINKITVPSGNWNLIFFFTINGLAQFFDVVTFTGNPHINTVLQMEVYSFSQNMGGSFTGAFTSTNTVEVLEWFSNTNFAINTLGSISIAADTFYADPTSVAGSSPYQYQQDAFTGRGTGISNLGNNNWGSFKDFGQATGYGNFFAANDASTIVYVGKIGKFTVATLPAGKSTGTEAWVTDGSAVASVGTVAAGGGALFMPVYFDGTNWRYG